MTQKSYKHFFLINKILNSFTELLKFVIPLKDFRNIPKNVYFKKLGRNFLKTSGIPVLVFKLLHLVNKFSITM